MSAVLVQELQQKLQDANAEVERQKQVIDAVATLLRLLGESFVEANSTVGSAPDPLLPGQIPTCGLSALPQAILAQLGKHKPYYGLIGRTANRLKVSRAVVRSVAYGRSFSPVILESLLDCAKSMEGELELQVVAPLSAEEGKLFKNGGRCHGGQTRVADRFGVHPSSVSDIAAGRRYNREILMALRQEIADASELVAEPPLTFEELQQFRNGQVFHGLFTAVAKDHGVSNSCVAAVAHGDYQRPAIMADIRARMTLGTAWKAGAA